MSSYFEPLSIGTLTFPNRIWMPPMTRARADASGRPVPLMATYYAQRASAGLIISEGVYINDESCSFDRAPGLWRTDQVDAWKPVVEQVHRAGGRIFAQLWHCGRIGSVDLLDGRAPLSPSGLNNDLPQVNVHGLLANGRYTKIAASPSRAMTPEDIQRTIDDYGRAASNAREAGFDGVEMHAANGYLLHQFLSSGQNLREDRYGGSPENRARLLMDALSAVGRSYPMDRVGVRVSPLATYNNARDPDPATTYRVLAALLDRAGIAYLHAADQNGMFGASELDQVLALVRPHFNGALVANGALTPERGQELLRSGVAQAVTFGRPFIANPDLAERIRLGQPLAAPRPMGWYAGGAEGYTDYPRADEMARKEHPATVLNP